MMTKPMQSSNKRVVLMQAFFIVGFLAIIGLESLFVQLIQQLDQVSNNERARVFIGELILHDIENIETDIYRMAIATGHNAQTRYLDSIHRHVSDIQQALVVLKDGGTVSRSVDLNLDVAEHITKSASYTPMEPKTYTLEFIELNPLIERILSKADELQQELELREKARQSQDTTLLLAQEAKVKLFIKQLPSFFIRLKENANRLTFETQQRLTELEQDIAAQKERYQLTKLCLTIIIIVAVIAVGGIFTRQIKRSNRQLMVTWQAMQAAKEEADKASRAKSDFVSRMSHELRTPLNAILGFAQVLEMEQLNAQQTEYVKQINQAGNHLLELINQVLDLAKIEAGKLDTESIPLALAPLITETADIQRERIQQKGLLLNVALSPQLPPYVLGDPTRLRQVLINLLGNAIKFTEQGSITLKAFPLEQDIIRFEVHDTGIGMDQTTQQQLFQAFTQADSSITRRYGGTGLGLTLCKEIVEAQQGRIGVESELGKGSVFWFELPMPISNAAAHENANHPTHHAPSLSDTPERSLKQKPILLSHASTLLVEDNPINQKIATNFLKRLGITPDIANNGQEALARLNDQSYDLVLLDLEMPVMDGYTTIRHIREGESNTLKRQLVIAMSANALNSDQQKAFELGVDDYITKPVEFSRLEQMLSTWFMPSSQTAPKSAAQDS